MFTYQLSRDEIILAVKLFDEFGLAPAASKEAILAAFRKRAVQCHPDKARSGEDRVRSEGQFKKLVQSRDILLELIQIDNLAQQIKDFDKSTNEGPVSGGTNPDRDFSQEHSDQSNRIDEEWKQFVSNEAVYFSLIRGARTTIASALALGASTFFFGVILSVVIAMVIWGIVAILSASVAIPFAGWIFGIAAVVWLLYKLADMIEKVRKFTLEMLSPTGYPFTTFIVGWISVNAILLLTAFWIEGWVIALLLIQNIGYGLLYVFVRWDLYEMQDAMDRIRNATNSSIVLVRAKKRFL